MKCASAGIASRKASFPRTNRSIQVPSVSVPPVRLADCSGSGPHDSGLPIVLVSLTPSGSSSFFSQPGTTSGDPRARHDTNTAFRRRRRMEDRPPRSQSRIRIPPHQHSAIFRQIFPRTPEVCRSLRLSCGRFRPVVSSIPGTRSVTRRKTTLACYVQDSFRLTPRLTLNYGLRWDYYGVVKEENNLFANFLVTSFDPVADVGTGNYTQVGTNGLSKLYQPDYKNFSPRASIAWDVTGKSKTVVRGGLRICSMTPSPRTCSSATSLFRLLCSRPSVWEFRSAIPSDAASNPAGSPLQLDHACLWPPWGAARSATFSQSTLTSRPPTWRTTTSISSSKSPARPSCR